MPIFILCSCALIGIFNRGYSFSNTFRIKPSFFHLNSQTTKEGVDFDKESVHLKLSEINAANNTIDNCVTLIEFFESDTNETIIASLGNDKTRLEYFSIHVFGSNYTTLTMESDNVKFRQKVIDVSSNATRDSLIKLWRKELLLSQVVLEPY